MLRSSPLRYPHRLREEVILPQRPSRTLLLPQPKSPPPLSSSSRIASPNEQQPSPPSSLPLPLPLPPLVPPSRKAATLPPVHQEETVPLPPLLLLVIPSSSHNNSPRFLPPQVSSSRILRPRRVRTSPQLSVTRRRLDSLADLLGPRPRRRTEVV